MARRYLKIVKVFFLNRKKRNVLMVAGQEVSKEDIDQHEGTETNLWNNILL